MTSQLPFEFAHATSYAPNDFLVSACNREAHAWVRKWPNWPSFALAIYGPPGCGKTHLAYIWRTLSRARFLTSKELDRFHPSRLPEDTNTFVVQDKNLEVDEKDILHLYNHIAEIRGFLLFTSSVPPSQLGATLPDLASRLKAMPAVAIDEPDDALLEAVALKHFSDRQLKIPKEVMQFLLSQIERSFAGVKLAVQKLDQEAMRQKRNITLPFVREVLMEPREKREPAPETV